MQVTNLYRYHRDDGGITVSPIKPDNTDYTEMLRLIADEGKVLTQNGISTTPCCDVDSSDGWYEIDDPSLDQECTEEDLYNALSEMGVDVS